MLHHDTKETGINHEFLLRARKEGRVASGPIKARNTLYKFIGPNTIITGKGLQHGVKVLRLVHKRIVDTEIPTRKSPTWLEGNDRLRWSRPRARRVPLGIARFPSKMGSA